MGVYKHVAIVDIDEFIVPFQANSLPDLIKDLESKVLANGKKKEDLGFIFPMTLFYRHDKNHPYTLRKGEHMLILKYNRRTGFIPLNRRTKFIVRPELVKETGVHTVQLYHSKPHVVNSTDTAALFHYRNDFCLGEMLIGEDHKKRYTDDRMVRLKPLMENTSLYFYFYLNHSLDNLDTGLSEVNRTNLPKIDT